MRNENIEIINDKYSGFGQDIFVMEIFGESYNGTFIDIGAREPINHNNTFMLEQYGWKGIAFDIIDYSMQWKYSNRKTPFICTDALKCDFKEIFNMYKIFSPVDYLSLDVEGNGDRVACLKNVLKSEFEFKVITIEHDAYRGYIESERSPQRNILTDLGYKLVVRDDSAEDWWINPNYIHIEQYEKFISSDLCGFDLFKNININFTKYYK